MSRLLAGVLAASLRAAAAVRRRPTTRHIAGPIRMPRIAPIRLLTAVVVLAALLATPAAARAAGAAPKRPPWAVSIDTALGRASSACRRGHRARRSPARR
jgi:hypothetical protein